MGRLVILSGPSCVGKGPLHAALKTLHTELAERLQPLVLYNDRSPRPAERDGIDYHFRSSAEIERLRHRSDFIVMDVRGDLQALDLNALEKLLAAGDAFFEGNPFVGCALLDLPVASKVEILPAFLSPLSRNEVHDLGAPGRTRSLDDVLTDIQRRKLIRRTEKQKGALTQEDRENIDRRAASACRELKLAWRFRNVIPNHDGEDSENWNAFGRPIGDARKALRAFVDLLESRPNAWIETWTRGDPL